MILAPVLQKEWPVSAVLRGTQKRTWKSFRSIIITIINSIIPIIIHMHMHMLHISHFFHHRQNTDFLHWEFTFGGWRQFIIKWEINHKSQCERLYVGLKLTAELSACVGATPSQSSLLPLFCHVKQNNSIPKWYFNIFFLCEFKLSPPLMKCRWSHFTRAVN